jgi:integrase
VPFIGGVKLSALHPPRIAELADQLTDAGRSRAMVQKVLRSLSGIFSEAQRRGLAAKNPVRAVRVRLPKREQTRPAMPTKDELRAMLAHATGRFRPMLIVAIFCGLRASELRGLLWQDVDLDRALIHVRRRADKAGAFGPPKSEAGTRDVPLAPLVVHTLKEWRLACPPSELGLVFPSRAGTVMNYGNILHRQFHPLQVACGVVEEAGHPKFGMHDLRHATAALLIEQGLSPKRVQTIMGHSSIAITYDRYGYLFDRLEDDRADMRQLEARLLSV